MTDSLGRRRQAAMDRRRDLNPGQRTAAADAVAKQVTEAEWFPSTGSIGLYVATGGEVDPASVGDHARGRGLSTWYPIPGDGPMTFRRWDGAGPLDAGPLGIPVPPPDDECAGVQLDMVIVPLVLFGPNGVRVGRGGGHYDRTFAGSGPGGSPLLCGVAYDFQEDGELEGREWDVPLDVVVTPTRTIGW